MKNWFDIIQPHEDIRKGDFDEAVFAADLGNVVDGSAPPDYGDPRLFFRKTYLTDGLRHLLARVHGKLTTGKGQLVIEIQTPFGGGKTHSLVTIYHYLKNGGKVRPLLPEGLDLLSPKMSVIVGTHHNPVEGRQSDGITRRTSWGEIGYQLAGREGYVASPLPCVLGPCILCPLSLGQSPTSPLSWVLWPQDKGDVGRSVQGVGAHPSVRPILPSA